MPCLTPCALAQIALPMGREGSETHAVLSADDFAFFAFGTILDAPLRMVSTALIGAVSWSHLRDTVRGLSVGSGTGFGFEVRLGASAANAADIVVVMPRTGALGNAAPSATTEARQII